jgi:hypothetical protein
LKAMRNQLVILTSKSNLVFFVISLSWAIKTLFVIFMAKDELMLEPDSDKYIALSKNFASSYLSFNPSLLLDSFQITPGYPLFISFLSVFGVKGIILIQVTMQAIIQILIFRLVLSRTNILCANISILLLVLDSANNIENLHLLSETLFTFLLVISLYLNRSKTRSRIAIVSGLLLGIAIYVRPIGQVIIPILVLLLLFSHTRKRNVLIILATVALCIAPWIIRNEIVVGVPQFSGIQSYNLLYFEGAGARAIAEGSSLLSVQSDEMNLEIAAMTEGATIGSKVQYENSKGLDLIMKYPASWIKLHIIGVGKILFGPSLATTKKISESFQKPMNTLVEAMILTMSIISAILLSFGTLLWLMSSIRRKNLNYCSFIFLVFLFMLAASSAANAYSRFRAPLSPLMAVLVAEIIYIQYIKRFKRAVNDEK